MSLFFHNILKPYALFDKNKADKTFYQICQLNAYKNQHHMESGVPAETIGYGYADAPGKNTVE